MINNYIYNFDLDNDYNDRIINEIMNNIFDSFSEIHNDDSMKNILIRFFNEESNDFQIQFQRDREEIYIIDIELRDENIYIIQSILDSNEEDFIEENIELLMINNLLFEDNQYYKIIIYNFIRYYFINLYNIDILYIKD